MKQKIAYIVISYKPDIGMLQSLLRFLPASDVIIIDNGGTIDSSISKKATVLTQQGNKGFATASNIGIRHAIAHGYHWFVLLNQDIRITKKSVLEVSQALSRLTPCVAGAFCGSLDRNRWTTIFPSEQCTYISGSCIAIHRKVIEKVGYFFDEYFLYYEEVDYCVRAARRGFPILQLSLDGVTHVDTASLGKGSYLHQYYLARNHFLFVERLAPFSVKLHELVRLPKTVWEHIVRHEQGALHGVRDYLLRRFGQKRVSL